MTDDKTPLTSAAPPGLRLWPALLILVGYAGWVAYAWSGEVDQRQTHVMRTLLGGVVSVLLLGLWLLLGSRLPWRMRLSLTAGLAAVALVAAQFVEIKGVSGDFVPEVGLVTSGEVPPAEPTVSNPQVIGDTPCRDYAQYQGARRDAVVRGLSLPDWTTDRAPQVVWRRPVGAGWSAFAVSGDRAVTQEQHGPREAIVCYELRTGKRLWITDYEALYDNKIGGIGPRATPTIVDGRVYTQGSTGVVCCVELADGALVWKVDVVKQAKASPMEWGNSCSPLIHGDRVLVTAGPKGWSLVALAKEDGEVLWHHGDPSPGHASPVELTLAGKPQLMLFHHQMLVSHDPTDGAVLWQQKWNKGTQCCSQPVPVGSDKVLVSTGYGAGARLYQVSVDGETVSSKEVWRARRLRAKFSNLVVIDDHVYALSDGTLVCFRLSDGQRTWRGERYGHGQVIRVGNRLLVQAETGEVVLVSVNPRGVNVKGRLPALTGKTWNPPCFAAPLLLVRNATEAICFRIPVDRPKK